MLKLLLIVLVGWAVTFGLRALPFVLFAGRDRPLPPVVERLGAFISPVIIAGLVVYSYSGLEWKTAWPYLAGVLTVGLQLWKRNALVSILAGTAVYMLALHLCGCATAKPINVDRRNPSLHLTTAGIRCDGEPITPKEVVRRMESTGIPHDKVIHIFVEPDVRDLSEGRALMFYIGQAGYPFGTLVTRAHAEVSSDYLVDQSRRRNPNNSLILQNRGKEKR